MNKFIAQILSVLVILSIQSGCGSYVKFTSSEYNHIKDNNKNIEEVQFFNSKDIIIWKDNVSTVNDISKKGTVKSRVKFKVRGKIIPSRIGVLVQSTSEGNSLFVTPDKNTKKTLEFQKLENVPYNHREAFINEYFEDKKINNDLFYLIPKRIEECTIDSDIISGEESGFFTKLKRLFRKKGGPITITCCVIDWGDEEWKMYMKKPTFLEIKRKQSSKSEYDIKEIKGNYIQ